MSTIRLEKVHWIIILILVTISIQCIYALLQLIAFPPSHSSFKLIGSFENPDHLAGYIASGLPLAFGILIFDRKRSIMFYVSMIAFILGLVILPITLIRGAWLATFVGCIAVFYYRYRNSDFQQLLISNQRLKSVFVFISISLLLLIIISLYQLKPDSVHGRLLIWKVTSHMIFDYPLTGVGINQFQIKYNRYQEKYFAQGLGSDKESMLAGNIGHAHNEYLQIIAETGLFGFLFTASLIWLVLVKIKLEKGNPYYIELVALKGSIIAVLTSGLFAFPFHILPTLLNFLTFTLRWFAFSDSVLVLDNCLMRQAGSAA